MIWSVENPTLYHPDHFVVTHLFDSPHAAIVWFGFTKGQSLREHQTSSTAVIQVLRGHIELTTDQVQTLAAGQAVALKPHERHALTALEDSVVQLILVPHPHHHSLADELNLPPNPPSQA